MVNTAEKLQIGEQATAKVEIDKMLEKLPEGGKELKERKKSKKKKDTKYQIGQDEGLQPVRRFGGAPKIVDMTKDVGFEL